MIANAARCGAATASSRQMPNAVTPAAATLVEGPGVGAGAMGGTQNFSPALPLGLGWRSPGGGRLIRGLPRVLKMYPNRHERAISALSGVGVSAAGCSHRAFPGARQTP